MHMSYVHPLTHVEGMLIAYLPTERILIEADLFDSSSAGVPVPTRVTPANRSLFNHVRRLSLNVQTIVPIHGAPVTWSDFARLFESGR